MTAIARSPVKTPVPWEYPTRPHQVSQRTGNPNQRRAADPPHAATRATSCGRSLAQPLRAAALPCGERQNLAGRSALGGLPMWPPQRQATAAKPCRSVPACPNEAWVTFDRVKSQPPALGSPPPDWGHFAPPEEARER